MHEITVAHKQYQMRHALCIHNHHIIIKACMNIMNEFFYFSCISNRFPVAKAVKNYN